MRVREKRINESERRKKKREQETQEKCAKEKKMGER